MFDRALVLEILSQLLEAAQRIARRIAPIDSPEDFLSSEDGRDRMDGIAMMLIVIGEGLKNLDKVTDGTLLARYPQVDWKGAKGARDILSHHYADVDAEVIFNICGKHIPILSDTIRSMIDELNNEQGSLS